MYAPHEWLIVRLTAELAELEQVRGPIIEFKRPGTMPFDRLYLTYHLRCVAELDAAGAPIYRDRHQVVIDIPPDYPEVPPVARMTTGAAPPFHPNFWNHGPHYGLICTHGGGAAQADPGETLAGLVLRIARMLQYDPQATQVHMGPNDAAAHWYQEQRDTPGLFPTDRQVLPLPGLAAAEDDDESFVIRAVGSEA